MLKKLSLELAIIYGLITVVVGSIYNNERNIAENKKNLQEKNETLDRHTEALNKNTEVLKEQNRLTEDFQKKLEDYKKHFQEASNKSDFKSPEEFKKELDNLLEKYSVNSPYEHLELMSFSTSIILFCFVTFSALSGLIFNHYIKLYGDKYPEKIPKFILPLMKFYLKLAVYSNNYYITLILISQSFVLLIGIYMKFRGIA